MSLYAPPSKPLSSILSTHAAKTGMSMNSIIKHIQKSNPGMNEAERRLVKSGVMALHNNKTPVGAVVKKQALQAMAKAGLLQEQYKHKPLSALAHLNRMQSAPPDQKTLGKQQNIQERRMQDLARERRTEAEEPADGARVQARPKSIHDTSIGLQQAKQAKVGIGQVMAEQDTRRVSAVSTEHSVTVDDITGKSPLIDMNIG